MTVPNLDQYRPFLFEHLDIRGAWVRLGPAWRAMLSGRDYPEAVVGLLGETAAVSVLIAANLKQPGRLTFQLKGEGPVEMLVMDCDEQLRLRGMARHAPSVAAAPAPELLGEGRLLLTLDTVAMPTPYQSLVPLAGANIAAIFEHYLERSEQQPAKLILSADDQATAGFFLQKLPGADQRDADGWNRIVHLANTIRAPELLETPAPNLLSAVFPEEDIRLFDPRPVSHHCPEDWEKVRGMLLGLGRAECESILREQGHISVHDDICNRLYRFGATEVEALFDARVLH
jgi:molecular chaperone Hsp33